MYPTLYEAIQDLFGIEWCFARIIQSFGFFVAIAFLLSGYVFALELKRKEKDGLLQAKKIRVLKGKPLSAYQVGINLMIGFALGYKLLDLFFNSCELAADIKEYIFSLDGSFFGGLIGAGIAGGLLYWDKRKNKYDKPTEVEDVLRPHQHIGNITLLAAFFGILGAKIFHLLENPDEISGSFQSVNAFFSGLTMYGGLIFGAVAVLVYAKKNKLTIFSTMDSSAPGLMLAYGIGRIGCQIAGDGDWGIPNDAPMPAWLNFLPDWVWAYNYPNNVLHIDLKQSFLNEGYVSITGNAWPTPLYEAVACIGLFFILWGIRKRIRVPGVMFGIYLIMNGIERFFIEKIRVNEVYHIFGNEITQAEIIAVILVIVGGFGIWYLRKHKEKMANI